MGGVSLTYGNPRNEPHCDLYQAFVEQLPPTPGLYRDGLFLVIAEGIHPTVVGQFLVALAMLDQPMMAGALARMALGYERWKREAPAREAAWQRYFAWWVANRY